MPTIQTLPIAPNPQYRRAAPLPTPEIRQGRAISEAGRSVTEYANQQAKLRQAYEEMVSKRQAAILAAQLDARRMAEVERSNLAQEKISESKAQFDKEKWNVEKQRQERETKIKEAEELRRKEERAAIKEWANKVAAPMEGGKSMSFADAMGLGEAAGIAHTKEFDTYMKLKYPNRYRVSRNVYFDRVGREQQQTQSGYINNMLRARRLQKELEKVEAMPVKMVKKYVTHPPKFAGFPSTKVLEALPDDEIQNAVIKLINGQIQEAKRQAIKNLSERGFIETELPQDVMRTLEEGYQAIEEEYKQEAPAELPEKKPVSREERIDWLLRMIQIMEGETDADSSGL
jgi:hypothetical protein